ncbi:glycosyltransferase family 2 protein [Aneurinibacillus tyrosinisolvens]|uniref:glycosyltransferase family 2 protein n=1 Tax=Aneurinibacillus tyrosinisolvens TaxID=1443435 RepID=UPI001F402D63|nr:glycosyltransferase family 2 protein [Aneurinibacillus tyrosinisolvens]
MKIGDVGIEKVSRSPLVSVIIPAKNESRTIVQVIRGAKSISPDMTEVIVVCNGTTDRTAALARKSGARVLVIEEAVGLDVGRAIGAKHARGDILLFIDADFTIPAALLCKYVTEVKSGSDLVLNGYSGSRTETTIHSTSQAKRLLNKMAGRPDLQGSSMTTVPHAISRRALEVIGYESLAVPPQAQVKAIIAGLKIARTDTINVAKLNKKRAARREEVTNLVLGDHCEAIAYLLSSQGKRGGFTDFLRKRDVLCAEREEETTVHAGQEAMNGNGRAEKS